MFADVFPVPLLYVVVCGYLLGSIPTAFWLAKYVYRINIFEHGSKNMGATNVFRVLGKGPGSFTLFIDILKGVVGTLLPSAFTAPHPAPFFLHLIAGAASIAGHSLSFWVGFKGGKGVATGLGVFLALAPRASLGALAVFLVTLALSRYVSLGSILASAALPVLIAVFREGGDWCGFLTVFAGVIAGFIIYKHKANIQRLLKGEELALTSGGKS
jgi:glycerol-3-phosphate acyltransferase PlsY